MLALAPRFADGTGALLEDTRVRTVAPLPSRRVGQRAGAHSFASINTTGIAEACTQAARRASRPLSQQRPISVTKVMARLEGFEPPTNGFGSHS